MPKRFGRNQKRKMRAQIQQWQEAHRRECELASWFREKGRRDKETVQRVADVLGEHFAALEPKTMLVDRMIGYLRLPAVRKQPFCFEMSDELSPCVEMVISEIKANWLELKADKLTDQQFVVLRSPCGDAGYALSRSAVLHGDADHLAREVVSAMQPFIKEAFQKQRLT
ncbi:hypothetical protein HaloA020_28740 [Halomonas sp. A020]|uniref:hypothetical protein n=1 Tax=Halomonas sp. A020 TaxID=2717374 RepID=UPI00248F4FCD|nr:hypothetical protein [Halomonas sp. A020]BCB62173.1 hypothetical protein HaloA020_28740 [Halomonas sp. A020]